MLFGDQSERQLWSLVDVGQSSVAYLEVCAQATWDSQECHPIGISPGAHDHNMCLQIAGSL